MTKYEMFKPYRELLLKEFNNVLSAAYNAEEEVLNANQYWKSSDTLNRLLISIRRSKQRLDRKYAEISEESRVRGQGGQGHRSRHGADGQVR